MWKKGILKIGNKIILYWIKYYEEGSSFGIDNGRISKLMLKRNDEIIAHYDRGWDLKPIDSDAKAALAALVKEFN